MTYQGQFRILDDDLIVDTDLSVFVRIARIIHEGDEGIWSMKLIHDPDMPVSVHDKIARLQSEGDLKSSAELFPLYSDDFYSFFEFNLVKHTENECLIWDIRAIDTSTGFIRLRSMIDGREYPCENPKEFRLYVFKNLLLFPGLTTGKWQGQSIVRLTISANQFACLTGSDSDAFSPVVVLDEQSIGGER